MQESNRRVRRSRPSPAQVEAHARSALMAEADQRTEAAVAALARAMVEVARPLWARGDGRGGWVLLEVAEAAYEAGLEPPSLP